LLIDDRDSPLPMMDSTRILARAAIREAQNDGNELDSAGH
jgi:aspartate/glutamate racemase